MTPETRENTVAIREAAHEFLVQLKSGARKFAPDEASDDVSRLLYGLFLLLCDRGRGALALLDNGLGWDAEIILRSYYECAAKILYVCHSPPQDRTRLAHEFWVIQGEVNDRKTAMKAAMAEAVSVREENREIFRLLQSEKMVRKTVEISKADRKALESRWSFSSIIEFLATSGGSASMPEARSLLHIYGMASHLAHADSSAIDLMIDRATRPREELALLEVGHVARILTDIVSLGAFGALSIQEVVGSPREPLSELISKCQTVISLGRAHLEAFNESQREFYNRMREPG